MSSTITVPTAHLRVARPTNDLEALLHFYQNGLGLSLLDRFTDHAGFDGVMLGAPGGSYHLEFTRQVGHPSSPAPSQDNLLVFYLPDARAWAQAVERMIEAGYPAVTAHNPYWDIQGRTFEDPDGYRVVLQNAAWAV